MNVFNGAAVLAGGKSRRMGRDKAMLRVGGMTLLDRALAAVRPVAAESIVVADAAGRFPDCGSRVIPDLYPGEGPVGGVVTALTALGCGAHLVVGCDMPFLQPRLLQSLLDAITEDDDAVVPRIAGRPEPLCAVYRSRCIAPLREFLAAGGHAARGALEALRIRFVEERDLRKQDPNLLTFININTPADAARWLGPEASKGESEPD